MPDPITSRTPELCARVDFGVGALGACIEKAW